MSDRVRPRGFDYAQRADAPLQLDLYHPGGGTRPLILFGYGGGFAKGSRDAEIHQPFIQRLCGAGCAVAVPDYRLKTSAADVDDDTMAQITRIANRVDRQGWSLKRRLHGVRLFTACEDFSDALRFCRDRGAEMQIAPDKIGMLGVSAGALAGNTLCYPPGVWHARFAAPDAMVSLCAPVVHPWRIRADGPPLWIIHGRKDRIVPSAASETTAAAAAATSASIKVTIPPDAPHIGIDRYVLETRTDSGNSYFDDIIAFLRQHIAKA